MSCGAAGLYALMGRVRQSGGVHWLQGGADRRYAPTGLLRQLGCMHLWACGAVGMYAQTSLRGQLGCTYSYGGTEHCQWLRQTWEGHFDFSCWLACKRLSVRKDSVTKRLSSLAQRSRVALYDTMTRLTGRTLMVWYQKIQGILEKQSEPGTLLQLNITVQSRHFCSHQPAKS